MRKKTKGRTNVAGPSWRGMFKENVEGEVPQVGRHDADDEKEQNAKIKEGELAVSLLWRKGLYY